MATVIHEFKKYPLEFDIQVYVTAQHRNMLDQVIEIFNIVPDFNLDIMKPGQSLSDITSRVLVRIKSVLEKVKPDVVLVHRDITTTFATSLATFYQKTPMSHVKTGLGPIIYIPLNQWK